MPDQAPVTTEDVREQLIDYREVQNLLDKVVKQHLESSFSAFHRSQDIISKQVFEIQQDVKSLRTDTAPIIAAWGDGKTTTKIMWIILKGFSWVAGFIIAVGGAVIVIKEAIKK